MTGRDTEDDRGEWVIEDVILDMIRNPDRYHAHQTPEGVLVIEDADPPPHPTACICAVCIERRAAAHTPKGAHTPWS